VESVEIAARFPLFPRGPATTADPLSHNLRDTTAKIRFFRFDGIEEGTGSKFNAVKDFMIEGTIPYQLQRVEQILDAQVRDFTRLGQDGRFFTAPEYPKEAWYEAVVNACVHRSYGLKNMNVFVKMFDDRLEVVSPGGFPPLVTPQNIYTMHQPRNPHLMSALLYLDFVKCANEGTRRMRQTMTDMSLPPPEFTQEQVESALVRVTLRNNIAARKVYLEANTAAIIGEVLFKTLTPRERLALNFLAEHGRITVSDAQRLTGLSWAPARKVLMGLATKGIVTHIRRDHLERDPDAHFVMAGKPLTPQRED
jgi:ATP-dependent DNA helicase RecG